MGRRMLNLVFLILLTPCAAMAQQPAAAMKPEMQMGGHDMAGHMYMTSLRPREPGDQQRADAVAAAAKKAMAPYTDYKKALADGYEIFLPDLPQPQYHFTRHDYGREAWTHFDPTKPTSLLYKKKRRWQLHADRRHVHGQGRCNRR